MWHVCASKTVQLSGPFCSLQNSVQPLQWDWVPSKVQHTFWPARFPGEWEMRLWAGWCAAFVSNTQNELCRLQLMFIIALCWICPWSNPNRVLSPMSQLCPATRVEIPESYTTASSRGPRLTSGTKSATAVIRATCWKVTRPSLVSLLQLVPLRGTSPFHTAEVNKRRTWRCHVVDDHLQWQHFRLISHFHNFFVYLCEFCNYFGALFWSRAIKAQMQCHDIASRSMVKCNRSGPKPARLTLKILNFWLNWMITSKAKGPVNMSLHWLHLLWNRSVSTSANRLIPSD